MLSGRTILITGAGGGLGRALSLGCAQAGAELVLADINDESGVATVQQVRDQGGKARFVHVDLENPASIEALANNCAQENDHLDGLVNNGAIATGIGGLFHDEIDIETWDRVSRVNVRGTWLMVRACTPLLEKSTSGRIVNIASDTALWGAPKLLSYVASKGAVISMTRSLARELGPKGIGIAAIAPGILTTESTEYVPQQRHDQYAEGRAVPGTQSADDISGAVNFLLSEGALAVTGQVLPTNRGFVFT